jgi:hypothetical protein
MMVIRATRFALAVVFVLMAVMFKTGMFMHGD